MAVTPQKPAEAPSPHAPSHARKERHHGTTTLDTVLVLGVMGIIGGVLLGLFIATVPQANLPIISGLAGALVSAVISGYAGYRWGASDAMKNPTEGGAP